MCVGVSLGARFCLARKSHGRLALQRLATWHLVPVARYLHTLILSSAYVGLGVHRLRVVRVPCCHLLGGAARRGLEFYLSHL